MSVSRILAAAPGDLPIHPDAATARQWLITELSKPEYQAAKPNWFDRATKAFWDWLNSLIVAGDGGWPPLLIILVVVIVVGALAAAFWIFGMPRLNRRAGRSDALFAADDHRNADALRLAATAAAAGQDWSLAIEEAFRALAASLADRTVIAVHPGTTAREVAAIAGRAFGETADRLGRAAAAFDGVRYLGAAGDKANYVEIRELDAALLARRPDALAAASALDAQ